MKKLFTAIALLWLCGHTVSGQAPKAPSNLRVVSVSDTKITVQWDDNSNNEDGFVVGRFNFSVTLKANQNTLEFSDLKPGTSYTFYAQAFRNNITSVNSPYFSDKSNALTVSTLDLAPWNLAATELGQDKVTLSWQYPSDNQVHHFSIYSSGVFVGQTAGKEQYFNVTGLTPGTAYTFTVKAFFQAFSTTVAFYVSAPSNEVKVTTTSSPPAAPTNLTATAINSNQIDLSWAMTDNDAGTEVYRRTDQTDWIPLGTTAKVVIRSWSATGLTADTKYYFRTRSLRAGQVSDWSNTADATTHNPPVQKPAAPTELTTNVVSSTQINLNWKDNADNEDGFDIEQSADNANWGGAGSVGSGTTSYAVPGLNASTRYYFRVRSKNGAGSSDNWSNTADATTQNAPVQKPAAPTELTAKAISSTQIDLNWKDNSGNEDGFDIERSADNTNWGNAIGMGAGTVTFSAMGLSASTRYYFRVHSKNSAGSSDWSNTTETTTQATPVKAVAAPENLRIKPGDPVQNQISLFWDDMADDETAYELSRSANTDSDWEIVKSDIAANSREYTDRPVRSGSKYFYRLRTVRNNMFSEYAAVLETSAPVVTGVEPDESALWAVYPNPFRENLSLHLPKGTRVSASMYSRPGICIKIWNNTFTDTFPAGDLAPGLYLIRVSTGKYSKVFKVIKE